MYSNRKLSIIGSDDQIMEDSVDETECQTQNVVVYLSSNHKQIFLRIISAERNFIKNPDSYPELVSIMTNELNEISNTARSESDWLQIMNAWINSVKDDYQTFIRSNALESVLSNEDEELIANLQENRVSMEPTLEQIKCAIEHLESEKNVSNLWSAIANDLDEMNGEPKRSITFWKRTFKRIIKRLTAKRDLFEHITRNYTKMKRNSCTLKPLEKRLLRAWMQSKVMNTANTEWTESSNALSQLEMEIENLSRNCRICLASTSSKMTNLFGDDDNVDDGRVTLLGKLNYCSCMSSKARNDDGFPQYICMSCSVLLESAYQLKLLCAKTEEKLNEMLQRAERKSFRCASEKMTSIVDETEYEINDDYVIEEVVAKQDTDDGDLVQSSHIEIEIINEMPTIKNEQLCAVDADPLGQLKDDKEAQEPNETYDTIDEKSKQKYQCRFCHKICKAKNALTVHMRTHTGERPYICETCGKGFKTSGALGTHRPVHSSEKTFICQYCPYRANTKSNLKIHDRVHSGVRPYKCRFCTAKFSTNSNMQKHMRNIHEKEKTNKCDECDRSFFSRESARKHMVTHTGLKPYKCTHCTMSYSWYNGLKKHVKAQHANAKIPTETSFYNELKLKG